MARPFGVVGKGRKVLRGSANQILREALIGLRKHGREHRALVSVLEEESQESFLEGVCGSTDIEIWRKW